jgi:hypothetical protein
MDDQKKLISSGAIVAGNAAKSGLIARMRAPKSKLDHMPPSRAPQPDAGEIDTVAFWIASGAPWSGDVASASLPGPIAGVAARLLASAPQSQPTIGGAPVAANANASTSAGSEPPRGVAQTPPLAVPPQRGGCASCSATGDHGPIPPESLSALLALSLALGRKRRDAKLRP